MPLTVYNASAGSGKTFTLAAYYIAKLLNEPTPQGTLELDTDRFKHMLAVTFSVKATGEMKDRILGTLYNLSRVAQPADVQGDVKHYLNRIAQMQGRKPYVWPEPLQLAEQARRVLRAILREYDRFRVVTIDSFFQSVLRGVARELGLPANLRTEISDEEVRRLAVERLMSNLSKDKRLQQQVQRFVDERIKENKAWNVEPLLERFSEFIFDEKYGTYRVEMEHTIGSSPAFMEQLREALAGVVSQVQRQMTGDISALLGRVDSIGATYNGRIYDAKNYGLELLRGKLGLMQRFATNAMRPQDDILKAFDLGGRLGSYMNNPSEIFKDKAMKAAPAPADVVAMLEDFSALLDSFHDQLTLCLSAQLVLANLHQLGLLSEIGRHVSDINQEKGQFILADTGALLSQLMSGGGNTEFIFDKIGPTLEHIMIDEFQDTSERQWNNFKPLFEELLSAGNDCLIVGDIKQSLYRWRNGDWKQLHGIADDPRVGRYVRYESLQDNFRSEYTIVDFNNRLFEQLADRLSGEQGYPVVKSVYGAVAQTVPPSKREVDHGLVRVSLYASPEDKADTATGAYADMIQQMLQLHQQGVPFGDMAILVREKKYTPAIQKCFEEHPEMRHVKVVSGDAFQLQSSWAVWMIVSALRLLHDRMRGREWEQCDGAARGYCLLLAEQHPDFSLDLLDTLRSQPLLELCERLIALMHLSEYGDQTDYLNTFLDHVAAYVQNNPADISSFLEYWQERLCQATLTSIDADAIQVVTYHVSKGLDFEHVFIPDCDYKMAKFIQGGAIHWVPTAGLGDPFDRLPVLPVDFYSGKKVEHSLFAPARADEVNLQAMDAINLLYVAFTRARQSLYVWGEQAEGTIASVLGQVMESCFAEYRDASSPQAQVYLLNPHRTLAPKEVKRAKSRIEPLFAQALPCTRSRGDFAPEFRQHTQALTLLDDAKGVGERIAAGTQMHAALAYIGLYADVEESLRRYRTEHPDEEDISDRLRHYLQAGMAQWEEVRHWFDPHDELLIEQTLLVPESLGISELDTLMPRPDRVMVDADRVTVVDYKFSRYSAVKHDEEQHSKYQRQLAGYMKALRHLYPHHQVEGYLWYLNDNFVESITL